MVPYRVTRKRMTEVTDSIVEAVREKAAEYDLKYGVVVVSYDGGACFESLAMGEKEMHSFTLELGGSQVLPPEATEDEFTCDCLGVAISKINAADKAYMCSERRVLVSEQSSDEDNILGRKNWGGCVIYPLSTGSAMCGKIMVAVSGGTEAQDIDCAWAAYEAITDLSPCQVVNPGRAAYYK